MSASSVAVDLSGTAPSRFIVSIWAADGTRCDFIRVGGCYVDHALEAIDSIAAADGLGARIKVRQLPSGDMVVLP